MALRTLEAKWKAALVSILEELTEQEFKKLLFKLNTIPQGVKSDKTREEIPHIIVQYYGTEKSISIIDKEMKLIPRNDAAVQQLLLPFVENLKKQQQKIKEEKSKVTTDKKPKPAADKKSKVAAGSGPVAKKPKSAADKKSKVAAGSGPVAKKPKSAAGTTSKFAADSGAVAKKPKPAADQLKSCRPDEMLPFGAVKPQQTVKQESSMQPTGSMETKMLLFGAVKPQQTVTQESSMQPTGSMETKVQSAAVQTGRITIIRIKSTNKTYTHLVVEFNNQLQTVFVTTRHLANAFGYVANDDFIERFSYEIPLTAEAKVQGNKIIEIKNR